jgi:hypothetical protein
MTPSARHSDWNSFWSVATNPLEVFMQATLSKFVLVLGLASVLSSQAQAQRDYCDQNHRKEEGAVVGAILGGIVGGLIGEGSAEGIVGGAAAGGVIGGVRGDEIDDRREVEACGPDASVEYRRESRRDAAYARMRQRDREIAIDRSRMQYERYNYVRLPRGEFPYVCFYDGYAASVVHAPSGELVQDFGFQVGYCHSEARRLSNNVRFGRDEYGY